jgi:hypothetical protein
VTRERRAFARQVSTLALEGQPVSIQDRVKTAAGAAPEGRRGCGALGQRLRAMLAPAPSPGPPINPALLEQARERAEARQNRLADRVTAFVGSMTFVYIHILWFGCWIGFGVESYPYGLLTMIVSLEAIFLSTFVLISQNRADVTRQVVADQQWETVQEEEVQNAELLDLSRQILTLTREVHSLALQRRDDPTQGGSPRAHEPAAPVR